MKKFFAICMVLVSVGIANPSNAARSPTYKCVECGSPHGGLFDPKGPFGGLCPTCAERLHGLPPHELLKIEHGCGDSFFSGGGPLKNRVC